ncbi:ABC1 kinase family protein [Ornithinicoccus halotolerans]|uniref:ABC1 kinase family protein n=1 Tax=Ornithinicoccus halotolerans TaxID=1748220 RepID=UPI001E361AF3|nr:AarF/UbiB family protein [Ornithinicoccus halotolerans]
MDLVIFALASLVTVAVFAAVVQRLLGVRLSLWRTMLAALVALGVGRPVLEAMVGQELQLLESGAEQVPQPTFLVYAGLTVAISSVLAMLLLVIAEILVPSGTVPGPLELTRGWRQRWDRSRRYVQILRIAGRHGLARFMQAGAASKVAGPADRRALAVSLRQALSEAGVTYVKLGQQLSTRRELVGPEIAAELATLQDRAAPVPWELVRRQLEEDLGEPLEQVFTAVEPEPLAAASIAQVHAAVLRSGEPVVLKVRRPGIVQTVERDLDILNRLARTLERRTRWARAVRARSLAEGFGAALQEELDFTIECENTRTVAADLAASGRPAVRELLRVPEPVTGRCTPRLLVMERMAGTPLGQAGAVLTGLTPERRTEMASALLDAVLDQILLTGVFHVDLHPGNVLVDHDGRMGLLDMGSVGRLDRSTRDGISQLLNALGRGDSRAAAHALLELVERPDVVDERELERALGSLILRYTSAGSSSGIAAFSAMFRLVTAHRLGVPPEVAAVFRSLATLEGTLTVIAPDYNLAQRAREVGQERLREQVDPRRVKTVIEDEVSTLVPLIRRLPRRVDRLADTIEHGRLSVNVRLLNDPGEREIVTGLLHQVLLTVLAAASGLMAALLLRSQGGPLVTETVSLHDLIGYGLLIASVVLSLRVLILVLRRDPEASHREVD